MEDAKTTSSLPFDARIDTVLALLNLRPEYASRSAELVFTRAEIAALLKLSGDPWVSALLAELSAGKKRADRAATNTPYSRIVQRLVGKANSRQASARLMRRVVNRPIDAAMVRAQDLLARLHAHNLPLNPAAKLFLYEQLLGIQRAWARYGDLMLQAYILLIDNRDKPAAPQATPPQPPPQTQQEQQLLRRRRTDKEPLLH